MVGTASVVNWTKIISFLNTPLLYFMVILLLN
jgi:hypothetical protein